MERVWYLFEVYSMWRAEVGDQTSWGHIRPNYEEPEGSVRNIFLIQCQLFKMQQLNLTTALVKLFSCCILGFLIKFPSRNFFVCFFNF